MELDPELSAMSQMIEVFNELEHGERKRIVDWIINRFQLGEEKQTDEIKLHDTTPTIVQQIDAEPIEKQDLKQYKSMADLLEVSTVKKVVDRILVAAAYIQEKKNVEELTSFEINTQLKKAERGIPNISIGINRLLEKVPQLMAVTQRDGNTKQSRRKFKVTEDGLKKAKSFLK
jgi:hypothetical protein